MTCKDCFHYDVCEENLKYIKERFLKGFQFGETQYTDGELCNLFKDKSRFIELLCNVGDTVYEFYKPVNQIIPYEIEDVHIDKEQTRYFATAFDIDYNKYLDEIDFNEDEIGKTVFLTKEEAEKALKEKLK